MGRKNWQKKVLLLILVAMVGGYQYTQFAKNNRLSSEVSPQEKYWFDTGLASSDLEALIQDQVCLSSEKYFLACVNAIDMTARRFQLQLDFQGNLQSQKISLSRQTFSEKERLEPWKSFYKSNIHFSFLRVWNELKKNYITKNTEAYYTGIGINGMMSILKDPHTYILPVRMYEEMFTKPDVKTVSLGLVLDRGSKHYFLKKILEGSVSADYGLKKGDELLSINGVDVSNLAINEISELMKGPVGEAVEFKILRKNKIERITILRENRTLPLVTSRVLGELKPLGLISLNKFNRGVCEKVSDAILDLKKKSVQGIILDLRDNSGGHIDESSCVAGLFMGPLKEIFTLKFLDSKRHSEIYFSESAKIYDGPLVVLINSGTASAAEILAGAIQDYRRGLLMGTPTFGKGTVQEGQIWDKNSKIALFQTQAVYQLPSGRFVQLQGLVPDRKIFEVDNLKTALRESNQYLFPLKLSEQKISLAHDDFVAMAALPKIDLKNCLDAEDVLQNIDDQELAEARQVIQCSKTAMSGKND